MRERRFIKGAQVRAMQGGKPGIEGYGAVFGEEYVLYDSPTLRIVETVKAGTFSRALTEKQDVRCLFNHEPDNILGRTTNDTMRMKEDTKGLYYETDFDMRTHVANDVRCFVDRGDVTGCSFSFDVKKQERLEEETDQKLTIRRTIQDVDLFDVGPVTYPAYEGTGVKARSIELRSVFPEGVPANVLAHAPELRELIDAGLIPGTPSDRGKGDTDNDMEDCSCLCRACVGGDCDECDLYMETCGDAESCGADMHSARAARDDKKKTKRVDGEDLPASAFLYVGDPDKTATWTLQWKFSTDEKLKKHLRNALARFSQTKKIPSDQRAGVYKKLVAKCKEHGIHVSGEPDSEQNSEQNSTEVISLEQAKARTQTLQAEMSL